MLCESGVFDSWSRADLRSFLDCIGFGYGTVILSYSDVFDDRFSISCVAFSLVRLVSKEHATVPYLRCFLFLISLFNKLKWRTCKYHTNESNWGISWFGNLSTLESTGHQRRTSPYEAWVAFSEKYVHVCNYDRLTFRVLNKNWVESLRSLDWNWLAEGLIDTARLTVLCSSGMDCMLWFWILTNLVGWLIFVTASRYAYSYLIYYR